MLLPCKLVSYLVLSPLRGIIGAAAAMRIAPSHVRVSALRLICFIVLSVGRSSDLGLCDGMSAL